MVAMWLNAWAPRSCNGARCAHCSEAAAPLASIQGLWRQCWHTPRSLLQSSSADCTEPHTAACAGGPGAAAPFGRLLGGPEAVLAEPAREQAVQQAGIPCTTVRTGRILNAAGGKSELLVQLPDSSSSDAGSIR